MKIFISIILFALLRTNLVANISAPPKPRAGDITGTSQMKEITVLHEDLTINLSEVVDQGLAKVHAYYKINCPTTIKNLELVFIANNLTESKYLVELDGNFINGYLTKFDSLPDGWLPPDSIPWNGKFIPFKYNHEGLISFKIDSIPPGEHTLSVSYEADIAQWYENDDLSIYRAFVYILKPSKSNWKQFNTLNTNIFIPGDWDYTSNVPLERHVTDGLHGYWDKIPSPYLSIVIKAPTAKARIYSALFLVGTWVIYIGLVIYWMNKVIKFRMNRKYKLLIKILNIILLAFITTIFFYFIYFTNHDILKIALDNNLNPWVTYGTAYYIFGFPILAIAFVIIITLLDYILSNRIQTKLK